MNLHITRNITDADVETLTNLLVAQQLHQFTLNSSLQQMRSRPDIEARLAQQRTSLVPPLVVHNERGQVRGYAHPAVWSLKEDSLLLSFLTAKNGIAHPLILPDPADQDANEVMLALLTDLDRYWRSMSTSGDLIRWPSCDSWIEPLIGNFGFHLDSICAYHPRSPFFSARPLPSESLNVRLAQPKDEEALVGLFHEELLFHEHYTPFVHGSPQILSSFRRKLGHIWDGMKLEDGAPLVLVVEQGQAVLAMAENTLLTLGPDTEPGFTPPGRYWCIDNVCVHEAMRRQGLGHLLVQAIEDALEALALDVAGYLLWYNPDNPQAGQFWPSLGFKPLWTTYQRITTDS